MADALIVKDTNVGRRGPDDQYYPGSYICGEAITAGSAVFLHTDGKIYNANRTAHVETDTGVALYFGFVVKESKIHEPVEVWYSGTEIHLAAGTMAVGGYVYVADTNGRVTQDVISQDVVIASGAPDTTVKIRVSPPIAIAKSASEIILL